jgi:hypothetical protein
MKFNFENSPEPAPSTGIQSRRIWHLNFGLKYEILHILGVTPTEEVSGIESIL